MIFGLKPALVASMIFGTWQLANAGVFASLAIVSPTTTVSTGHTGNTTTIYSGVANASSATNGNFVLSTTSGGLFTSRASSGTGSSTISMTGTVQSEWRETVVGEGAPSVVYIKQTFTSTTSVLYSGGPIFTLTGKAQTPYSLSTVSTAGGAPYGTSANTNVTTHTIVWSPSWTVISTDGAGKRTFRASYASLGTGDVKSEVSAFTLTSLYPGASVTAASDMTAAFELSITP